MHIINVTVRDKIATHVGDVYYVCGNSDFVVHFDFDDEWDALDVKTARFICEDGSFRNQVFSGSECPVPIISNTNNIRVGVFAGNLCTTTPARVPAAKSILCPGGMPAAPEDDAYHQVMKEMAKVGHEARSSAEASAQSAQEAATSAQEAAKAAENVSGAADAAKNAQAAAQAARQSEAAAAASAESAEKAKQAAIDNADDAEDAAKSAQASTQTAGTLAAQAGASAQNAAASAQAAKQFETAAAAAAQTAGTDATASAQNAQAAAASASSAATSADNAAASAQAAKQSETAAATSAQTAGTDATASAQNAQAAAASASSAATSADNAAASAQAAQESAKVVEQSEWAGKVYVVTTAYNDDGQLIADRSPRDIEAAVYRNRMAPLLLWGTTGLWYKGFEDFHGESCPAFYAWSEFDAERGAYQYTAYITSDCVVYFMGTQSRIPNPEALTIGGVAYDGSKAVAVMPAPADKTAPAYLRWNGTEYVPATVEAVKAELGVQDEGVYELIDTIVCDGTYGNISKTGLALTHAKVYLHMKAANAATSLGVEAQNDAGMFGYAWLGNGINTGERWSYAHVVSDGEKAYIEHIGPVSTSYGSAALSKTVNRMDASTPINRINVYATGGRVLPAESVIEIWGVRANA